MTHERLAVICLWTFLSIALGNVLAQVLLDQNWLLAFHKTWSQGFALLALFVFAHFNGDLE